MSASYRHPLVYLVGTAGHPNYGDEVTTAGWLRYYADRLPEAEIWLDTPRPGQTAVLHGASHPHLRCVDTLFHACWNAPSDDPPDCVDFGAAVIDDPGRLAREASGLTAAAQADLVHVIGGGYINQIWPRHLTLLGAARRIKERSGARLAMTGAGLTPTSQQGSDALRAALATFDVVDVRDGMSADILAGAVTGVRRTGDDALLDLQRQQTDRRTRVSAVVEIQSDLLDVPLTDLAQQAVRLLKKWGVDQHDILLLESLPPGDLAVLDLLRPHLPRLHVRPFELLWRDGLPVAATQLWITTRFHSHLMAAAAGAWGVAVAGSDSARVQHQALIEMGSGWRLSTEPTEDIDAGHPTSEPFDGGYADLVTAKREVADTVVGLL